MIILKSIYIKTKINTGIKISKFDSLVTVGQTKNTTGSKKQKPRGKKIGTVLCNGVKTIIL